ncbi:MAG: RsmE family RNA methyltransferase [Deltaproteobacteria bacterium]
MNLLLLFESDRRGDAFVVTDYRATHVREVLQKGVGDTLKVGLVDGPVGVATIVDDAITLTVAWGEVPPRPSTVLIVAVPRPKSLKKLLPEVTALGVDTVVLVRTWRTDKAYLGSPLLEPEGYRPLLVEGLMQARDTHLPNVIVEPLFKPFVEDRAPALGGPAVVLHPGAATHLAAAPARVIAIGPEGGFTEYEVEAFERAGFARAHLGPRVLRVETAAVSALAVNAAPR